MQRIHIRPQLVELGRARCRGRRTTRSQQQDLYAGRAYDVPLAPDRCTATAFWNPTTPQSGTMLGWAVAALHDAQVAVGAPAPLQAGGDQLGAVWLRRQPEAFEHWNESCCPNWDDGGDAVVSIEDASPSELGWSLAVMDTTLVVGAPAREISAGPLTTAGAVHLLPELELYDLQDRFGERVTLDALDPVTLVAADAHRLGLAIHVGHLDGDDAPDLVIADATSWWVVPDEVFAAATPGTHIDIASHPSVLRLRGGEGWEGTPEAGGRLACDGVTSADLDGDGHVDLAVGACDHPDERGRVYVVRGPFGADGWSGRWPLDRVASFALIGTGTHDFTGSALATLAEAPARPETTVLAVGAWGWDLAHDDDVGAVSMTHPGLFTESGWDEHCR